MKSDAGWTTLTIERLGGLPICEGRGRQIVCVSGELWITQYNDTRDIVLKAGETFTMDRRGLTLVHALRPSTLRVSSAALQSIGHCADSMARQMRSEFLAGLWRRLRGALFGAAA